MDRITNTKRPVNLYNDLVVGSGTMTEDDRSAWFEERNLNKQLWNDLYNSWNDHRFGQPSIVNPIYDTVAPIIKAYGYDRTAMCIASVIRHACPRDRSYKDGRYDYKNINWAYTIPVSKNEIYLNDIQYNTPFVHPANLDQITDYVRTWKEKSEAENNNGGESK